MLTNFAERGWIPDRLIRTGIRRLLVQRLKTASDPANVFQPTRDHPIAIATDAANRQHYEVAPEFYRRVLGPRLKYSCSWYEKPDTTLDEAERAMLDLTCRRAGLQDGMNILELGCGWGSLTLWMAENFPNSTITAVSNAALQRATIEALALERGLTNVRIITSDINAFQTDDSYDRIVSVEMFEHVRNHVTLLERIAQWLTPEGRLYVHIFCHDRFSYTYEDQGKNDWMARHFFSGGMMPSFHYFQTLPVPFRNEASWRVNGLHYARTCRDWLARLDADRPAVEAIFARDLGPAEAAVQVQRWRIFFMACEELFAWNNGDEWYVGHYLLGPSSTLLSKPRNKTMQVAR